MKPAKRITRIIPWAVERIGDGEPLAKSQTTLTQAPTRDAQRKLFKLLKLRGPSRKLRDVKYTGTECK